MPMPAYLWTIACNYLSNKHIAVLPTFLPDDVGHLWTCQRGAQQQQQQVASQFDCPGLIKEQDSYHYFVVFFLLLPFAFFFFFVVEFCN